MNKYLVKKTAVLWTGGKDCYLALWRAKEQGENIACLATFVPENKEFQAHPLERIKAQALELGIPIHFLSIVEPFRDSYIQKLRELRDQYGIARVVTGDIDYVDGHPNWIAECSQVAGVEALFPLWKEPRSILMEELVKRGIQAEITWLNHPMIPKHWLGRRIDQTFIDELNLLNRTTPIDLSGENGEYHSMVVNLPKLMT